MNKTSGTPTPAETKKTLPRFPAPSEPPGAFPGAGSFPDRELSLFAGVTASAVCVGVAVALAVAVALGLGCMVGAGVGGVSCAGNGVGVGGTGCGVGVG